MKTVIYSKETGAEYRVFPYTARVGTRNSTVNEEEETEIVVYAGGHGYAFSTRFYDVIVTE